MVVLAILDPFLPVPAVVLAVAHDISYHKNNGSASILWMSAFLVDRGARCLFTPFFLHCPAPDPVAVGDTIGLIEVMKSFSPVTAEAAGKIATFHVEDEDAVMPGQPLADIEI